MNSDKPDNARDMALELACECMSQLPFPYQGDELDLEMVEELLEPVFAERDALRERAVHLESELDDKEAELRVAAQRVDELEADKLRLASDLNRTEAKVAVMEEGLRQIYAQKDAGSTVTATHHLGLKGDTADD